MKLPRWVLSSSSHIQLGASDGIGKETALGLAKMDPGMIIMACRESEKARHAHQLMCEHHTNKQTNVVLEFVDLADLSSIKGFVGRLSHQSITVDVLINNAGVILNDKQQTKDGFEMQVCVYYGQKDGALDSDD